MPVLFIDLQSRHWGWFVPQVRGIGPIDEDYAKVILDLLQTKSTITHAVCTLMLTRHQEFLMFPVAENDHFIEIFKITLL